MAASLENTITEKVHKFSEAKQQQLLKLVDELLKEEQAGTDARPIWEILAELSAQVPAEE